MFDESPLTGSFLALTPPQIPITLKIQNADNVLKHTAPPIKHAGRSFVDGMV
jgi:hypothetical protein